MQFTHFTDYSLRTLIYLGAQQNMLVTINDVAEKYLSKTIIRKVDIYDFYDKMDRNKIMLSFKGDITSELLTSILQIMESKLDNLQEEPKVKKKVYNVLVECLQNLYHHMDEVSFSDDSNVVVSRSAIFMIGKVDNEYSIITGNYILTSNVENLKVKLDRINEMTKEELKEYYKGTDRKSVV